MEYLKRWSCVASSMHKEILVDLFAEDYAREAFIGAVAKRVGTELGASLDIRVISARGGHPRVAQELQLLRIGISKGIRQRPDIITAATDGNCFGYLERKKVVDRCPGNDLCLIAVIACP